ncbi:MAG: GNAT family N-acetyltransferase [Oscillospiraceae bacterium]
MFGIKRTSIEINVERSGSLLMIKLYRNHTREARIQCVIESDSTILIGDIIHDSERKHNKGYGSAMMSKLIEYATENGYSRLYGNLSDVDLDHKDRLYHFYKKFGFEITEYPKKKDCYFGMIEKIL